jgi:hypothetical protein
MTLSEFRFKLIADWMLLLGLFLFLVVALYDRDGAFLLLDLSSTELSIFPLVLSGFAVMQIVESALSPHTSFYVE